MNFLTCIIKGHVSSYLKYPISAVKALIATIILGSFSISASASTTVGAISNFADTTNPTWVKVITLTTPSEADNQSTQTMALNVTELPPGGADYRVMKTLNNGSWYTGNAIPLTLGINSISVNGTSFDRSVKNSGF